MEKLVDELAELIGAENVFENEPLSAHTTFKIGGPAEVLVTPESVEQIRGVLDVCRRAGVAVHYLGYGSNILAADEGVRGVCLKLARNFSDVRIEGDVVMCQAGASNSRVARRALEARLGGYEFAAGIPGTNGGAAIMNAGAYGGEFKDVALSVDCITPEGELVTIGADEADWSYRHSMMLDRGYLVVGATLRLAPDNPEKILAHMEELAARRRDKQPLDLPSAGSTFKRPEGYFAGKLIQDAGMQGHAVGGAQVSTKHAGFVVNTGGATAADVRALIAEVQAAVFARDGVHLEPEVRMWD